MMTWLYSGARWSSLSALCIVAALPLPASACGFHDPNSILLQRGALNLTYPKALYVQGGISSAVRAGLLRPEKPVRRGDLIAFHRTATVVNRWARQMDGAAPAEASFSMVLIGPMLWTTIHAKPSGHGHFVQTHATGPLQGRPLIVTDIPVLKAMTAGGISAQMAARRNLIRLYGPPAQVAQVRHLLEASFPAVR
jgi:hypothetical protein